jgi:hypothetical protein
MPSISVDLNLTYDRVHQVWRGWFHRRIFAQRVVLSRPRTKPGARKSRLVGTWNVGDNPRKCLPIAQQEDGGFTAWHDTLSLPGLSRYAPGIVPLPWTSERYGESASVSDAGPEALLIGSSPYTAAAGRPAFGVRLSKAGDRLVAGSEGTIASMGTEYRRMEGDSCRYGK